VYTDRGGRIGPSLRDVAARTVSDVGITAGALAFLPAMDVVRQALPMVPALLKMWVGIRAGNLLQGLSDGTQPASQAGSQGFSTVMKIASM
jgi:hypothetical protein